MQEEYRHISIQGIQYEPSILLKECKENLASFPSGYIHDIYAFMETWLDDKDIVSMQTSGSTGPPKTMHFAKEQLVQSAMRTGKALRLSRGDKALLALPVNFIAGKMMIVRAFVLGLDLYFIPPKARPEPPSNIIFDFAALLPMQVHELLHHNPETLHYIHKLIIGGGVISPNLLKQISQLPNETYSTYGMTETLTHIALKRLNGNQPDSHYTALDSISLSIDNRDCLIVFDPVSSSNPITTNDVVEIITEREFEILGRYDNLINTGGIKIPAEKLENKIESIIQRSVIVCSEKDDKLGERLVLIIEGNKELLLRIYQIWQELEKNLQKHEVPKRIEILESFNRLDNGKTDRRKTIAKAGL